MKSAPIAFLFLLALLVGLVSAARGETLILTQGGQVVGEIQNPDETPRQTFVIKTADGSLVTLARSQVKQVVRPRPEEIEYEKIRPTYADTPEGQWALAEWCKEKGLLTQRKVHLERIVQLDSKHEQAHRALGYVWKNGEWTTTDEMMKARGMERYKGRWRTPQEIEVLKEKEANNLKEKEWMQKTERWRSWLASPDKAGAARENLLAIEDPVAWKGLAAGLNPKNTANPDVRSLFARALGHLGTTEAKKVLAGASLFDPNEEVRLSCLDHLKKIKDPAAVDFFVGKLRDKDNVIINRAAAGLKEMKDPSAIGPLIDALVTVHRIKIPNPNAGKTSAGFGSGAGGGGGGMSVGEPAFKTINKRVENRDVLDALAELTGVNYAFDLRAWRSWYASQKKRETIDARRGA